MTINERIELIISTLKMNNNSFSQRIGVNATVIHNIIKGRNAPSYDILNKIALSFDNINMNWLISENGSMIIEKEIHKVEEPSEYYMPGSPSSECEKCKIKDELISSLKREVDTQGQFIKHLVESDTRPVQPVQKHKGSASNYTRSKVNQTL